MKLYVDDLRKCPEGWNIARTITDTVRHLFHGNVHEISLDHDIVFLRGTDIRMQKESFMPVVMFMCVMSEELRPTKVRIHTANVDAGWKMEALLTAAGYKNILVIPLGDDCNQEDINRFKKEI